MSPTGLADLGEAAVCRRTCRQGVLARKGGQVGCNCWVVVSVDDGDGLACPACRGKAVRRRNRTRRQADRESLLRGGQIRPRAASGPLLPAPAEFEPTTSTKTCILP